MLLKIVKSFLLAFVFFTALNAVAYNAQAEKDRKALHKYFNKKFKNPVRNAAKFFPHFSKKELKRDFFRGVKSKDLYKGLYSFHKPSKEQYDDFNEFPPYEFAIDEGEKIFNKKFANGKSLKTCLGGAKIKNKYPYFDTKRNEVITIEQAINECRVKNGEKAFKTGKGPLAKVSGYIAFKSRGQVIKVKIPNKAAQKAYERGKKMYYGKSGYLYNSCAACHVQGAGNRVRTEFLSPLLGAVTNYPVYRIKWKSLGTLHRRIQGCHRDQGNVKLKRQSKRLKELEYFMTYMSNGMKYDGPDIRK